MKISWKLNLWILWFTQILSLTSFSFGFPFLSYYIAELEPLTPKEIEIYTGNIAAAPALAMAIFAPIWGILADKYGKKLMIMRALFAGIIILAAMSLVQSVNQLYILRVMQGAFTGTITAAVTFVASNTPKKQLSYALGVISSSTFIGLSIGPLIGSVIALKLGYRHSFLAGSFLIALSFFLVLIFVKEEKKKKEKITEKKPSIFKVYKTILVPVILNTLIIYFMLRLSRTVFSPYLALFIKDILGDEKLSTIITGVISAVASFVTAFASFSIGKLAVKKSKLKLMNSLILITFLVSIALSIIVNFVKLENNTLYLGIFILVYGLFFLSIGGIEPLLVSISAEKTKKDKRGALFGLQATVGSLAWFTGPIIAGRILERFSLNSVVMIVPVAVFINLIFIKLLDKKLKH